MIKIDKGIPIKNKETKRGRAPKYPWPEMEIGDSFFIKNPPRNKKGHACSIISYPNIRYAPKRFVLRAEGKGVRIWRTE